MKINLPRLFIEINNSEYIFTVGDENDQGDLKIIYENTIPLEGIESNRIIDINLILDALKKNIYLVEQKLNYTFKETVLILDNFELSFINLTGFKRLNGSQILNTNITYVLNTLKSNVDKTEDNKKILHIFNSKYTLDKKDIENLPVGLYGNFYTHELSFCLINVNDYKNIKKIFDNCNIKVKKIFCKSFIEGSLLSDSNVGIKTFFQISINKEDSKILYFENDSLKFQQNFNFGFNLILKDISKITALKIDIIKSFLAENDFSSNLFKDELIERKFFKDENFIKIKKKLIYEIAEARIQEFFEVFIINNINFKSYKKNKVIFLKVNDRLYLKCFKNLYDKVLSNYNFIVKFNEKFKRELLINNTNKLVHFGWKKEAIPVTSVKKSIIVKFFDILFN